jgi:positive regulator of sigma E activity
MGRVAGIITQVKAGRASVACGASAQTGCAVCASGRGCGWQRPDQDRRLEIDAWSGSRMLEPGDTVEIEIDDNRLLLAACRLYLPPLCGVLAGPLLLRLAGLEAGVAPLLAAAVGLGLGALVARRWTRSGVPVQWQGATGAGGECSRP